MDRYDIILGKTTDEVNFFDYSNDIEYMRQKVLGALNSKPMLELEEAAEILNINKTLQDYGKSLLSRAITSHNHYKSLQEIMLPGPSIMERYL